ncbi:MAG: glycerol-3-phosphate responsive antiterminator [Clostridiaceae bacterium]|jgi:glycerol uptake operon antiterminator|nr:glycerol-3-phosphate responsive antiterminator [Clostridiaceae bacterium]
MDIQALLDEMIANPVIAAIRSPEALSQALRSPPTALFLLSASINDAAEAVGSIRAAGKRSFLHVDLMDGLRPDAQGMSFVASQICPDGIISTKPGCIRMAQSMGLLAVQRIFLLDSSALRDGEANIRACRPDLVEVLPGVAVPAIRLAVAAFDRPLIAGGLIRSREEVMAALGAGALAVSTGERSLWSL